MIWMLPLLFAQSDDDEEEMDSEMGLESLGYIGNAAPAPKMRAQAGEMLSATAGGAQDMGAFRAQVSSGVLPSAEALLMEGLLSEHDLPPRQTAPCPELLCVIGETAEMAVAGAPDVEAFAQLGFATNIRADAFQRPPVDLVVLLDASGSMAGLPLEMARLAVIALGVRLQPEDRVSVLVLRPGGAELVGQDLAPGDDAAWHAALDQIPGAGGWTPLHQGVEAALVHASKGRRPGRMSRVMVVSDQRPSQGPVQAEAFVHLAEIAAGGEVGLTWLGVGEGAPELAAQVSAVRGGNSLHVRDPTELVDRLGDELDFLITPLAYDLSLEIRPASGWRLAGVYGVPGAALTWDQQGIARMQVPTLFPSREGGAIYLGFARETLSWGPPAELQVGSALGTVGLSYEPVEGPVRAQEITLPVQSPERVSPGLVRGRLLVEEVLLLSHALEHPLDPGAHQALRDWQAQARTDSALGTEVTLVEQVLWLL